MLLYKISRIMTVLSLTFVSLFSAMAFAKVIQKENESYSFIQSADRAIIQRVSENTYTLTLKNVAPVVSYLTDRPSRTAGILSLEKFLTIWNAPGKDSFRIDPPNVALTGIEIHALFFKKRESYIIELKNPIYDAKNKTIIYELRFLSDAPKEKIKKSIHIRYPTLFIDKDWCPSCCC